MADLDRDERRAGARAGDGEQGVDGLRGQRVEQEPVAAPGHGLGRVHVQAGQGARADRGEGVDLGPEGAQRRQQLAAARLVAQVGGFDEREVAAVASVPNVLVVSKESGHILSLLDSTCNVVTNKAVEALYTPEERDILQVDYMWKAWDNSQMHRIAPNIDDMLAIWQEELAAAQ